MTAEEYLKQYRIEDDTIYNSVDEIVGTLSQIMNDYHENEKENNVVYELNEMCGQSLSPDNLEKWEEVLDALRLARPALKFTKEN